MNISGVGVSIYAMKIKINIDPTGFFNNGFIESKTRVSNKDRNLYEEGVIMFTYSLGYMSLKTLIPYKSISCILLTALSHYFK